MQESIDGDMGNRWAAERKGAKEFLRDENGKLLISEDENLIDVQLKTSELFPELYEKKEIQFLHLNKLQVTELTESQMQ